MSVDVEKWGNPFEDWPEIPAEFLLPPTSSRDHDASYDLSMWRTAIREGLVSPGERRTAAPASIRRRPSKDARRSGEMEIQCDRHGSHVRTLYRISRHAVADDKVARWTARGQKWQPERSGNYTWGAQHPAEVRYYSMVPKHDESGEPFWESRTLEASGAFIWIKCRCGSKLPGGPVNVVRLTEVLEKFYRAGVLSIPVAVLAKSLAR